MNLISLVIFFFYLYFILGPPEQRHKQDTNRDVADARKAAAAAQGKK